MGNLTVSIIIPSYNKVQYLPDCLLSIQKQSFTEFECIVVQDGAPDSDTAREAVERLNDHRFKWIQNSHSRGPGGARNCGAEHSTGRFILFVDEDDELRPDCLEKLLRHAQESGAAFVSPWAELFGACSGIWRVSSPEQRQSGPAMHVLGAGVLIERKWWQVVGGYDESQEICGREDYEFWLRASASGGKFAIVEEPLYRYRRGEAESSLSAVTASKEASTRLAIVRKNWHIFSKYGSYWRQFISGGYKAEAVWDWSHGHRIRCVKKLLKAFAYHPSRKTAKDLLKVVVTSTRFWLLNETDVTFS